MKKNILLLLIMLLARHLSAQDVHYTIALDDPEIRSKFNLNLELFHMDFSAGMFDVTSFNVGLWGHYEITKNHLQAEWILHKSWFTFGRFIDKRLPSNLEANGGVNFFLTSAIRQRKIKMVMKVEDKGMHYNSSKGAYYNIEEVTYTMVPGKVHKNFGVRGGIYSKTNPYIIDFEKVYPNGLGDDFAGKMSSSGIYIGGIINRTVNIYVKTEEYGNHYSSGSDNFYADILILPIASLTPLDSSSNEESVLKAKLGSSLGFRMGWKSYQVAPKKLTGKKFGLSGNFEIGKKPYLGIYVSVGLGITLVK